MFTRMASGEWGDRIIGPWGGGERREVEGILGGWSGGWSGADGGGEGEERRRGKQAWEKGGEKKQIAGQLWKR